MVKVLAVVALLAVAQILPSCSGGGPAGNSEPGTGADRWQVIGYIEEKRTRIWETIPYLIVINSREYPVTYEFFSSVEVGDFVGFDGTTWKLLRKRGQ